MRMERNNCKKSTQKYVNDCIFDLIDIEESLKKNKKIAKIKEEEFLYDQTEEITHTEERFDIMNNQFEILKKIATNNFGIRVEELILEYPNGYKIKLIDKFTPIDLIGQGSFGFVISAQENVTNEIVGIKIINKSLFHNLSEYHENEVNIQKKLDHENILKLYDVIDSKDYLFLIMELMMGGSLKDLILERYRDNRDYLFEEEECSMIIRNILQGIEYLHSKSIIHRDLKPGNIYFELENIMFKNKNDFKEIKIADFGLAISTENIENVRCGTILYMSPELIAKNTYDFSTDIWACGFILFILCSGGRHPVYKRGMKTDEYMEIIKREHKFQFPSSFPL